MTPSPSFDGTHRAPVDKTAAIITQHGTHHHSRRKVGGPHWQTPPPMRKPPRSAPPLIGTKTGRLTVIGLHKRIPNSWVVRCACGDYETRKARAIRNPQNISDRCINCRIIPAYSTP